jgi:hypothetical protein
MRAGIEVSSVLARSDAPLAPLIAHVVYRFDIGGLENGVVNLINRIPETVFVMPSSPSRTIPRFVLEFAVKMSNLSRLHKPPGNSIKLHFSCGTCFAN